MLHLKWEMTCKCSMVLPIIIRRIQSVKGDDNLIFISDNSECFKKYEIKKYVVNVIGMVFLK